MTDQELLNKYEQYARTKFDAQCKNQMHPNTKNWTKVCKLSEQMEILIAEIKSRKLEIPKVAL